jgi:hypothetical protein
MRALVRLSAGAVMAGAAAAASAQGAPADGWRPFVSVTPIWQGNADFDGGPGDYSAWSAVLRAGVTGPIGNGHRAGIGLNYDYTDYDFSGSTPFGGAPWNIVQRIGVSVPLIFRVSPEWSVGVTPSADYFKENGADWGDSLTYGAILSGTRTFAPDRRIGLGLGVFDRIEKTTVFPFIAVDWRFNERWRLVNPLPAGPTGPAGLEVDYRLTSEWSLGLGAAWRSTRFRLAENGPVPNGVGEERGVPIFLRASRDFGRQSSLYLYAGAIVGGKLRVENPNGDELQEAEFDPQPLLGATFSMRF